MGLTKTDAEQLNQLYTKYGLTKDHIFESSQYKIITRAGIDKIQAGANIAIEYIPVLEFSNPTADKYVVKAKGTMYSDDGDTVVQTIETFGEAAEHNYNKKVTRSGHTVPWYPIAIAEKRAMSRCVLKLAGLYEHGVFSEDESDEFKEELKQQRKAQAQKAQIKS